MNSLNEDMMREVAYFMNMRSFAAMSIVNRAWNAALSDRRVRVRVRVRNLAAAPPVDILSSETMEHWYHLAEIGREARLIETRLRQGKGYVFRLFTQEWTVPDAWRALDEKFDRFRVGADSWARAFYPLHIHGYKHL